MGASKGSPATQMLEWAVGKLDEASKTDWVEKFSSMASSKPAYLRNGLMTASPSRPAAGPTGGVGEAELDAALARAGRAEARADTLARRVKELEARLAAPGDEHGEHDDEHHKSHWWSRKE